MKGDTSSGGPGEGPALRRALVTGASGFIGAHLCDRLLSINVEVHAVSRTSQVRDRAGCQNWQVDLSDSVACSSLVRRTKPDVVFHLASCVTGVRSLEMVLPTFQSNLATSVNLLVAATEFSCSRIVLAGSSEEPTSAVSGDIPCSPYAAAKWASGMYGRFCHELYQTPVVTTRLFMTYGPAQPDERKVIPYVIQSLLRGQSPKLSSGHRKVDWIFVDDVVDGLIAAATMPNVNGSTFDLGSGTLVTVRSVVERLTQLIAPQVMPQFGEIDDRKREPERVADLAPARDRLGWRPATALDAGLERTVNWYRSRRLEAI
jgi:UDP-glucose 4-epimerase